MQTIKIERYQHGGAAGYEVCLEPEDKSWVLYIGLDGAPLFYPHRGGDGRVLCEGMGRHNVPRFELGVTLCAG